jgi:hypothetical protein
MVVQHLNGLCEVAEKPFHVSQFGFLHYRGDS